MSREKERWVVAIAAFVQVTLDLTLVFWGIENLITADAAARLHVWIGLVGGTLPDLDQYGIDRTTFGFAATLMVKFYLLLLPAIGIIALFYSLATVERRQLMRWIDLLKTRDGAIKDAILAYWIKQDSDDETVERMADILNKTFQEGGEIWAKEYLPEMFDEATVEALLGELQDRRVQER